ncbi:MAG: VCBS repeat-containing protein, partial [Planctomycetota bacterium]|nr:VCBS repeat-containing protein [Planctomycetota bacterium]
HLMKINPLPCLLALVILPTRLVGAEPPDVSFEKLRLTDRYYCDGVDAADIDGDGHVDVVAGPFWYAGPDFRKSHAFYPPVPLPLEPSPSNSMFSFVHDFSGDGRPDILVLGRVHKHAAYWYENPGDKERLWEKHFAFERVRGESPALVNLRGDQSRQVICHWDGCWGWIEPIPNQPRKPWKFVAIGKNEDWPQFYHGEGVGDVNGDGRLDLIINDGWYEHPAATKPTTTKQPTNAQWQFHRGKFSTGKGGAQMFAYDVDGDGDQDVISALDGHGWGLAWFEHMAKSDGSIQFREHRIMGDRTEEGRFGVAFSQPHALELADIDGDGLQDIVCGKRMWAHGPQGDVEPNADPVLYWSQLTRPKKGDVRYVPHRIDARSGVGVQITVKDVNGDRRPDVLTASKLGTFVFLNRTAKPADEQSDRRPRVLSPGERPRDTRLGLLKGEHGDFLLRPAASINDATARAKHVRRVMLVTMGLWPLPERTPLNAVVHGRLDLGDYTIEKVYFESLPGFFVTGSLYRPKDKPGRRAAVLSPHGHFPGGRFQDEGLDAVKQKIAAGAERFEDGGRSFMQSRCVQLARMGCVVFHHDMIGYADNQQISVDVAHRFSRSRLKFNVPPEHGFYSASALLNLNNQLGLHTWNSIRALDFLTSLPDVDPARIAVTGGSGGGTQTFMLCAVDDRPLVSVPVVIVSADRQGGCTCENICGFRIDTHNLDFTSLHAPKPLLLISADDATRTMSMRGFPELRQHYRAFKAAEHVKHVSLTQFPHNYNHASRAAMYEFVNRHLKLGLTEPIVERPYRRLSQAERTVFDDAHPRPAADARFEQRLLQQINTASQKQIAALKPRDDASLKTYREVVGGGWDVLLRRLPHNHGVRFAKKLSVDRDGFKMSTGLLSYTSVETHTAELPLVALTPKKSVQRTVIWIHESGKAGLFNQDGTPRAPVTRMLAQGRTVVGIDLLQQGEFLADGKPSPRQRALPGEAGYGGWTYCYNLPRFARQVHDILAVIQWVRQQDASCKLDIIGLRAAGPLVAAAVVQSSHQISRAAIHTDGFRFADVTDIYDGRFLPGAAKYGDVPGLLSLADPTELWVSGERFEDESIMWHVGDKRKRMTVFSGTDFEGAAVDWLLSRTAPRYR